MGQNPKIEVSTNDINYAEMKVYFYDPFTNNSKVKGKTIKDIEDTDIGERISYAKKQSDKRLKEKFGNEDNLNESLTLVKEAVTLYNEGAENSWQKKNALLAQYSENMSKKVTEIFEKIAGKNENSKYKYASYTKKIKPGLAKLAEEDAKTIWECSKQLEEAIKQSSLQIFVVDKGKDGIVDFDMTKYKKIEQTIATFKAVSAKLLKIQREKKIIETDEIAAEVDSVLKKLEENDGYKKYRGFGTTQSKTNKVKEEDIITFSNMYTYLSGAVASAIGIATEAELAQMLNGQDIMESLIKQFGDFSVAGADKTALVLSNGQLLETTSKVDISGVFNISVKSHLSAIDGEGNFKDDKSISVSYLTTTLNRFFLTSTNVSNSDDLRAHFVYKIYKDGLQNDMKQAFLYAYAVRALVGNNENDLVELYFDTHGGVHLITDFLDKFLSKNEDNKDTITNALRQLKVTIKKKDDFREKVENSIITYDKNAELMKLYKSKYVYNELLDDTKKSRGRKLPDADITISANL